MAFSFSVDISGEFDEFQRILIALNPARINARVATAEKVLFQKHLIALPSNKKGFPSTGFWAQCARSTNVTSDASGATLTISQVGFRQRYEGGEIRPKGGRKFLTLPAIAEAYGKRAGEFSNLRFGFGQTGFGLMPALVEAEATPVAFGRREKGGKKAVKAGETVGGKVFFWLARRVNQRGNEDVVPSAEAMIGTAVEAAEAGMRRV